MRRLMTAIPAADVVSMLVPFLRAELKTSLEGPPVPPDLLLERVLAVLNIWSKMVLLAYKPGREEEKRARCVGFAEALRVVLPVVTEGVRRG